MIDTHFLTSLFCMSRCTRANLNEAANDDYGDEYRQHELEVRAEPFRHLQACARIDFCYEAIKAPTIFPGAEESKDKRPDRQDQIADQKIFAVENASAANNRDILPYAE